nr:sensor histidine kinase [Mucilaginibacter sp. L294]
MIINLELAQSNPLTLKVVNHGIWWVAYIFYELSIYYFSIGTIDLPKSLLFYALNISLFYCHFNILRSTLGGTRNRYWRLAVFILAELFLFVTIKILLDLTYAHAELPQFNQLVKIKPIAILDLQRSLFFVGLSSLYWTASNLTDYERRARAAEISQLKVSMDTLALQSKLSVTENALLRQQINPHLIFNSLNFIHSAVYKVSAEAAETVILLVDILRFSMEHPDKDGKIFLSKEIDQIYNLVTLNCTRFKTTAPVDFTIIGDPAGHRIIPLVLTTLVENVFKHGNFIEHEVQIHLELSAEGSLSFHTLNRVTAQAPFPRMKSTGLENIRTRLDYAYGDTYQLQTTEQDGWFRSKLNIPL